MLERKHVIRAAVFGLIALVAFGVYRYFVPGVRQSDFAPALDRQIDGLLTKTPQKDAIAFLEAGGVYADKIPANQGMDKAFVLPFMKRLRDETGSRAVLLVLPESPNIAGGAAVPLPERHEEMRSLKDFMRREEKAFEGVIVRQYGNRWLYFDFIDPKTAKSFKMDDWDVE